MISIVPSKPSKKPVGNGRGHGWDHEHEHGLLHLHEHSHQKRMVDVQGGGGDTPLSVSITQSVRAQEQASMADAQDELGPPEMSDTTRAQELAASQSALLEAVVAKKLEALAFAHLKNTVAFSEQASQLASQDGEEADESLAEALREDEQRNSASAPRPDGQRLFRVQVDLPGDRRR